MQRPIRRGWSRKRFVTTAYIPDTPDLHPAPRLSITDTANRPVPATEIKESNMKTARIAKILSTAALVSLGLIAGTSQADNYGFYGRVNTPEFNRPGFGPGFNSPRTDNLSIDQRQHMLMARVEKGIHTGQLTRYEARNLVNDMRRIEMLERRFEADGHLGRGEWMELDRLLDKLAYDLREDMHDNEQRGGRHGGWEGHGNGYAWR